MLPPEGPSQSINCEEKRPLDDSQSILVQQKRGKTNMDPERFLKFYRLLNLSKPFIRSRNKHFIFHLAAAPFKQDGVDNAAKEAYTDNIRGNDCVYLNPSTRVKMFSAWHLSHVNLFCSYSSITDICKSNSLIYCLAFFY